VPETYRSSAANHVCKYPAVFNGPKTSGFPGQPQKSRSDPIAIIDLMPSLEVPWTAALHREVFPNGLTVLVREVHTAPLVSVWCWYGVGSRDEEPGRTGVSHWVEHMNFKGTMAIPRDQMKGIVERFGGMWNGYTWIDQTTYLETAGRDALDQLLFIEAERMVNGLYEPEECESERSVIISELLGCENDPDQLLDQEVTATAFRPIPIGIPQLGGCTICRR
jgi:zinc protease